MLDKKSGSDPSSGKMNVCAKFNGLHLQYFSLDLSAAQTSCSPDRATEKNSTPSLEMNEGLREFKKMPTF